jgi:hypothetical protein
MSLEIDPQGGWIQWAATAILAAFSGLIGLFVSFGRDAAKIYREKVDAVETKIATLAERERVEALEKRHSEFVATSVTRDDFREELDRVRTEFKTEMSLRFESIDNRHLQMHNHNATLMSAVETRLGELKVTMDTRMGELRNDIKDVHKRIDEGKK